MRRNDPLDVIAICKGNSKEQRVKNDGVAVLY
jgi:hypothetical protein